MAFWGAEVKPGKPYIHHYNSDEGRLHLSQATLGAGTSTKKCIVQCSVGSKKPIYLCSLSPDKLENCALNVEFEEDEEVALSVIGSHSVHLSGFFIGEYGDEDEGDLDHYDGHCVDSECESDESMDYDIEDEDDDDDLSDDDDLDMYQAAPVRPSGVKIEEILDDEKPAKEKGASKQSKKKKHQTSESNDGKNSEKQIVVKSSSHIPVLESEDEDGFPISSPGQRNTGNSNKEVNDNKVEDAPGKKDTVGLDQANSENITKLGKRKKKKNVKDAEENIPEANGKISSLQEANLDNAEQTKEKEKLKEKKKNKKKKRKTENEAVLNAQKTTADKNVSTVESELENEDESFQVRSFNNGLVVEEVSMGKPDGKKADHGKKISVRYIGTLKKNGKIFDSNVGKAPFKFRIGIGQVIKGWDVGLKGMRVGDKRRLTIPPSMGYGSIGTGTAIPPNAWLVFDVELLDVL